MRKIIVTNSLPYGNGDLHIGHLLGYINADIWARFQRMRGNICLHISGIDAHGTPIMIAAEQKGTTPEAFTASMYQKHLAIFQKFAINFDIYGSSHSPTNQATVLNVYEHLKNRNLLYTATVPQAFDTVRAMFLADRFVKGTCPFCQAVDQYGDGCEQCGKIYSVAEMLAPRSALTDTPIVFKDSVNYFFKLTHFIPQLLTASEHYLDKHAFAFVKHWITEGCRDWAISRDLPYYGFPIPGTENTKYFYVWFDAPLAYIALLEDLDHAHGRLPRAYWAQDSEYEIHQYIGKDIIYFHALFWPALLMAMQLQLPKQIVVNGFVTFNKRKMSKSRQIFVSAEKMAVALGADAVRYYFATKNNGDSDLNLDLDALKGIINKNLIGKIINIASRCAPFFQQYFQGRLAPQFAIDPALTAFLAEAHRDITQSYENKEISKVVTAVENIAARTNYLFNSHTPWLLVKTNQQQAHQICSLSLNMFKIIMCYLMPILPQLVEDAFSFLNYRYQTWDDIGEFLYDHNINTFQTLMVPINNQVLAQLTA